MTFKRKKLSESTKVSSGTFDFSGYKPNAFALRYINCIQRINDSREFTKDTLFSLQYMKDQRSLWCRLIEFKSNGRIIATVNSEFFKHNFKKKVEA